MYIDLHAHATRRGCFVFGNNTATTESLIETVTFAKLIAMNSPVFDFNQCNYTVCESTLWFLPVARPLKLRRSRVDRRRT